MANLAPGPYFQTLCQIWCKFIKKWLSYSRLTDFKMAAVRHLGFWQMRILMANLAVGPCFEQVMAQNVNFNMAAAAILDFVGYGF